MTLLAKFLTLGPKNYVTTHVFVRRIEGKIELKIMVREVVEARITIKFCVKLGYGPTDMFNVVQRGGDALEMNKVQCLNGIHSISKVKRAFKMAVGVDAGR